MTRRGDIRRRGPGIVVVAFLAYLVAPLPGGGPPVGAAVLDIPADYDVAAFQYNVAGLTGNIAERGNVVAYVTQLMATRSPVVVSLNELCREQYDQILLGMPSGYSGVYLRGYSSDEVVRGDCGTPTRGEYGNAVLMRYTPVDSWPHVYSTPASGSSTVRRNAICYKTSVFLLTYVGCSSHLTATGGTGADPPSNHQELIEYSLTTRATGDTFPIFALGDFNHRPSGHGGHDDAHVDFHFYSVFREADGLPKRRTTAHSDTGNQCGSSTYDRVAIDYVFGLDTKVLVAGVEIGAESARSDHCPIVGYFSLK